MLSKEQLYAIIDTVVAAAKGYNAQVLVMNQAEGLTRFANSEIHQNVHEDKTEVTIIITTANKRSEIKTSLFSETGLQEATAEAIANLKFLPEGDEQPPLVDSPAEITADSFNPQLEAACGIEERAQKVKECLDTLDSDYLAYGALTYAEHQIAVGNSLGIRRFARGNNANFSVIVAGPKGSGYGETMANTPEDFEYQRAFATACEKARLNQNPEELTPGAYTVILEPVAVGDLMTFISYLGFSGKSVLNQFSFLTGKLGEQVFDPRVTIVDDCENPNTLQLPFDFEGAPRQQVKLIEQGVAKALTYDMASARLAGTETTGHSVNMPDMGGLPLNLVMDGGDESLEEIIANTEEGLLITRFHYMNPVNPRNAQLTALTRDGVFKIKHGKIVGSVKTMRFTESMLQAFNNIEAISRERQRTSFFFGNYYVPALKIKDFHFTGNAD
ncbi:MAG: TldD/PmbA family protein [Firmicutes bacterium]|nr:TldD/PmbA family protein [Bacillota bacterium]